MKRRDVLKAAVALAVTTAAAARPARAADREPGHGRLQLGLAGVGCGNGSLALLDWYPCRDVASTRIRRRDGSALTATEIWDAGIYLDPATAELKAPVPDDVVDVSFSFYLRPLQPGGLNTSKLRWRIAWDGNAECRIGPLDAGGTMAIDDRAGHGTFTFGAEGGGNTIITFTIRDRAASGRIVTTPASAKASASIPTGSTRSGRFIRSG